MPTNLKFLTIFSESAGYGFTEVHYRVVSSDNPDLRTQLNGFLDNIAAKRALFLGQDSAIVGVRVSYPRGGITASFGLKRFLPGEQTQTGSAPALSLAVAMKDSTFTRQKIIHVRSFWDIVEINGVYQPGLDPTGQFALRLAQWKDSLITGEYGWLSKDPALSSAGPVTNYVVGPDNLVTFTLGAPGMPLASIGTQQQVRFSRLNQSKSVLNKSILCMVLSQTSLLTVAPHAAGGITSTGRFNFRGTSFVGYWNLGSVSLGERRMGKPLDRSPGRRSVQPTV